MQSALERRLSDIFDGRGDRFPPGAELIRAAGIRTDASGDPVHEE